MQSQAYRFWKLCFAIGALSADAMKEAVRKGRITPSEYTEITGIEYIE